MNWSRAKTILIFMFLATALFQSYVLYTSESKTKNISPEIIDSCVELLAKNQIEVKSDIIPKNNYSVSSADADNAVEDYLEFAKLILGTDTKKTAENTFSSSLGTVSFSGNMFDFNLNLKEGDIKGETSSISSAKGLLKKLTLDLDGAKESTNRTDKGYEITFTDYIDNIPFPDSEVVCVVENHKITRLYGKWFNIAEKNGSVKLKTITSVLIDLIKAEVTKPAQITDISLGYIIPENNSYQRSVTLVPVWRIAFKNGEILSVDARNPQ